MSDFLRVQFDALTDEDLAGLVRVCKVPRHGPSPELIVARIAANELSFWKLHEEDAEIRLILEIKIRTTGNELKVFAMYGRGLFRHYGRVKEFFLQVADQYFCTEITAEVHSKGVAKLCEAHGGVKEFTKYRLGEFNGQRR